MSDPATAITPAPSAQLPAKSPEAIIQSAIALVEAIPPLGEDASMRIVDQILSAQSAGEMDKIWESGNLNEWMDQTIIIRGIQRGDSTFKDGLGSFLICDCLDPETGESMVITTGSLNVTVQLAWAYVKLGCPFSAIPRVSERPTPDGYYPQRLSNLKKA